MTWRHAGTTLAGLTTEFPSQQSLGSQISEQSPFNLSAQLSSCLPSAEHTLGQSRVTARRIPGPAAAVTPERPPPQAEPAAAGSPALSWLAGWARLAALPAATAVSPFYMESYSSAVASGAPALRKRERGACADSATHSSPERPRQRCRPRLSPALSEPMPFVDAAAERRHRGRSGAAGKLPPRGLVAPPAAPSALLPTLAVSPSGVLKPCTGVFYPNNPLAGSLR
jgi:hypothetical protein